MATIKARKRADGLTAFHITVETGKTPTGEKIRKYKTWVQPHGYTLRQAQREAQRIANQFEDELLHGYLADCKLTFAEYAPQAIETISRSGVKRRTIEAYWQALPRINAAIGDLKLNAISPRDLNRFYGDLCKKGVRLNSATATAKGEPDQPGKRGALSTAIQQAGYSKKDLSAAAGVSQTSLTKLCSGKHTSAATAEKIAAALGRPVNALFTVSQDKTPLSSGTVKRYASVVSAILEQAKRELLIKDNPADNATAPKHKYQEADCLQPEELLAILDALEAEPVKWQALIDLMAATGCRRGEVAGLKWDKVDLEQGYIIVDKALLVSTATGEIYEDDTKTSNCRLIDLGEETVTLLKRWQREQLSDRLAFGADWGNSGYVFTKDNGAPMRPDAINAWIARFCKRHGLRHFHPHTLRHSFASIMIGSGYDVATVAGNMGHASPSTTEKIYTHTIQRNRRRAALDASAVIHGRADQQAAK